MTAASSTPDYARRIRNLAIGVVAAVALWTGGWLWLADRTVQAVRAASEAGSAFCTDVTAMGYPFRMGISCSKAGFADAGGVRIDTLNLRTAAQIYRPSLVIAEVDEAADVTIADGRVFRLSFDSLRASIRFVSLSSPPRLPARVSVEMAAPSVRTLVTGGGTELASAQGAELHMRKGDGDRVDIAATAAALRFADVIAGNLAFDASLDGASRIDAAMASGSDMREALLSNGGEVRDLSFKATGGGIDGASMIRLSGPFSINEGGLLSGTITITVDNGVALAPVIEMIGTTYGFDATPAANLLRNMGSGPAEIPVTIRDGNASVGFIPLGTIPPL
jgi:hypothetical protein